MPVGCIGSVIFGIFGVILLIVYAYNVFSMGILECACNVRHSIQFFVEQLCISDVPYGMYISVLFISVLYVLFVLVRVRSVFLDGLNRCWIRAHDDMYGGAK